MDMSGIFNQFHQPVGMTLSDWKGAPFPQAQQITGRYCKLERINAERHAKELYEAYSEGHIWRSGLLRPSIPSWIM